MNKNIAFIINHFNERGTTKATFDYAFFNEKILENRSIIIFFNTQINDFQEFNLDTSKKVFTEYFKIKEINYIEEITKIIEQELISHAYVLSHGFYRDIYKFNNKKIWNNCITIYHSVFGPMARQGSNFRCVIGEDLNNRYFKKLPVLPHMIPRHKMIGDLRKKLKINNSDFVFGRYGGYETFDLDFVKDTIKEVLKKRNDIFFLFLNTQTFFNHKKIIYLPKTISVEFKSLFIDTCDAMIHARKDGETFGLSVGEFSAANKPIITFSKSKDKEHLRILKNKSILYKNREELLNIFLTINKNFLENKNWNCYTEYEPHRVMEKFDKLLISNKISYRNKINNLLRDIPWELLIYLNRIFLFIKKLIFKKIPKNYKNKFKIIINKIKSFINNK